MSLQEAVKVRVCVEWKQAQHRHLSPMPLLGAAACACCRPSQTTNRPPPQTQLQQALRLVKADLEATKTARAALEAEGETKDATIATLQSKVREVDAVLGLRGLLVLGHGGWM